MFYFIIIFAVVFTAWIGWELYRAPNIEDDNSSLYDPTTTCWDDDKNHTEGDFH
jgi:hypothetical protein